ncbi:ribbon-helix-helix domain-containing protein [Isoptericola sp. NEAU-Y5]|uniref:Ribbon-helix-helix domain-containing protein n=1 Tax=Isoptericola luteus TaxID=2879484 RepID=A0ABS7ZCX5_9MICO|nr:ribbon-helix-helix domain-containing protein [Isoptericola sp. NEAU-Y5]MCA5892892.1 ribbon-helix-helix domain-containing protein [Isoptericola sp. NEAU-Y5]
MKVSVSLPEPDLSFLDEYADRSGLPSRSAALQAAVRALRERDLEAAYQVADDEWYGSGDAEAWDAVTGDGMEPPVAPR